MAAPTTTPTLTRMDDATAEQLAVVISEAEHHLNGRLVESMVAMSNPMRGPKLGYAVDRYEHSLQTASRAHREGPRIDLVVAAHFCGEWDQAAFDPDYDTLPLEAFVPMLEEVFTQPANGFKVN